MACLSNAIIRALAAGELAPAEASPLSEHLRSCITCSAKLSNLRAALTTDEPPTMTGLPRSLPRSHADDRPAERIGPYILLGHLGQGGAGTVYAAYHPELDRRVAIKLLRSEVEEPEAAARLLREAQAMARLDHPNVVAIHDVGQQDERVYLVMDKVDGGTLKQWLSAKPRRWRETVHVFLDAGRGLAAAHAAGMAHRDFKPTNVLMGLDGRVRVCDFGLARAVGQTPEPPKTTGGATPRPKLTLRDQSPTTLSGMLSSSITQEGEIVGTPKYMAPEQYASSGDQRSDQFSFCVALYDALYGEAPFDAGAVEAHAAAEAADKETPPSCPSASTARDRAVRRGLLLREPPKNRRVPRFVRRALTRGLAQNPADRFPSMQALLDALSNDPLRRAAGVSIGAAAVAVLILAVTALVSVRTSRLALVGCDDTGKELAREWNEDERAALRAAFDQAIPATAAVESTAVIRSLDTYAANWTALRRTTCGRAASVGGDETALLELSCLGRQKTQFQALVDTLAHADIAVAGNGRKAMGILDPPSRCSDGRMLVAQPKPPADPKTREEVDRLRETLATARVDTLAGKPDKATTLLEPLVQRAHDLHYGPFEAETLLALSEAQSYAGKESLEMETTLRAENTAEASGADITGATAASALVMDRVDQGQLADAHRWHDRGSMLLARVGGDPVVEAQLETSASWLAGAEGRDNDDLAHARRAYDLLRETLGPDHPHTIHYLANLGVAYVGCHRDEEAFVTLRQAVDEMNATLGEASTTPYLASIVRAADDTGRFDDADRYLARGMVLMPSPARDTSSYYCSLVLHGSRLRLDEGRPAEALALGQEGAEVATRVTGPTSRIYGFALAAEGAALAGLGRLVEGESKLKDALDLFKTIASPNSDDGITAQGDLALVEIQLGHPENAIPLVENALAREAKHTPYAGQLAGLRFTLARALALTGGDLTRARDLATQARVELEGLPWMNATLDAVNAWLKDHPRT